MSLDVYLYETPPIPRSACINCVADDDDHVHLSNRLFEANVTHNLGAMAQAAGIYEALWRPAELIDPAVTAAIHAAIERHDYHGPDGAFALEASLEVYARDIIPYLQKGLARMKDNPALFEAHNPPNGWGAYVRFVPWVEKYLAACLEYPDAIVEVSR